MLKTFRADFCGAKNKQLHIKTQHKTRSPISATIHAREVYFSTFICLEAQKSDHIAPNSYINVNVNERCHQVCLQLTTSTPEFLKAKRFSLTANDIFVKEYAY